MLLYQTISLGSSGCEGFGGERGVWIVKPEIVKRIRRFVELVEGQNIKVAKAVLYGSQVSVKTYEYSDVAIVSAEEDTWVPLIYEIRTKGIEVYPEVWRQNGLCL